MDDYAIKISNVKKMYKLGQIGGRTLQADLQSWWAKRRGKEDPNVKIGQEERARLVGQTFMALNGINLTVKKGEALGIIGGNGAGKSTLLKLLSRVTAPTEGEIDINGRITSMLEVGTGFNGEMTGRENVYMNGAILGMTKAEIDAKMEQIIDFSEVRDFIDTPVKRYSSGMYVKLAFSVAAHLDSEIMIMDEVLAVGDMAFQKKCLDKMRDAAKKEGRTVLYVSHNMNTIRQLCDRCVVLDKGKIIFEGNVDEAITLYLGTAAELRSHYEYTKEYHTSRFSTDNFVLEESDILNGKNNHFARGEKVLLRVKYSSKKTYKNVKFRFNANFSDGTHAGIALTSQDTDFISGEEQYFNAEFDTTHLASGKYRIDIIVFSYNQFGAEEILDGVYPGFFIEIDDKIDSENKIEWLHQYWGHIRLHDVEIRKE